MEAKEKEELDQLIRKRADLENRRSYLITTSKKMVARREEVVAALAALGIIITPETNVRSLLVTEMEKALKALDLAEAKAVEVNEILKSYSKGESA